MQLFRPPDKYCRQTLFYHQFFLLSFFHFCRLISELAEQKSPKISHMLGSNCNLKTHVQNLGYPLPYKSEAKNLFWMTSKLNGYFNGLCLRNEMQYRQSVKCVDDYKGFLTSFQNVMNFGPQTASNSTAIFTHLCKLCFLRHCQVSQTEISIQKSTKLCQMTHGKSR